MDIKKVKDFKADAIYEINKMVDLIDDQAEEIDYLKDKLEECKTESLSEICSHDCPTEEIVFDGEYDFYE